MEGLFGCKIFQNAGVRELIQGLSDGAPMHVETIRRTVLKNTAAMKGKQQISAAQKTLEALIQKRVLRQGIELQCERCQRHCWYGLGEFADDFKCKRCFQTQSVSMLGENPWHYVSDGLFTLPRKVAGCLTSAAALVCLQHFLHHDFKFVSSFEYSAGANQAERDFAIFASSVFRNDVDLIFGECKTSENLLSGGTSVGSTGPPDLQQKEKDDMRDLGKRTGSYLAFCTFAADFSDADKEFFREMVREKQKLILLTKTHLEMDYMAAGKFLGRSRGAPLRIVEQLSRLTTIDTLGNEFAMANEIWI